MQIFDLQFEGLFRRTPSSSITACSKPVDLGQTCTHPYRLCRDARVMDQALAMHDACLRSMLHQYYGYEVTPLVL